jgi:hypothetical protein
MDEQSRIDFERINRPALAKFDDILRRWLPDGRTGRGEYVAAATRAGRIDAMGRSRSTPPPAGGSILRPAARAAIRSVWAAFLFGLNQAEAAGQLVTMLGISADG